MDIFTESKEKYTKWKITNTLTELLRRKAFVQITVTELCTAANLSRGSFYRNFDDKYAILNYYFDYFCGSFSNESSDDNFRLNIERSLTFIECYRIQLKNILLGQQMDYVTYILLYESCAKQLLRLMKEKQERGTKYDVPITVLANFFASGMIYLKIMWLKGDCDVPKVVLADYMTKIAQSVNIAS